MHESVRPAHRSETAALKRTAGMLGLVAAAGLAALAADAFSTLNITQREASEQAMQAITAGGMPYGAASTAFRKLSGAARGAVTQELATWAKAYVSSAAFKTAYAAYRNSQKPEPPSFQGSVDDEFKKKQAETMAGFAETRKNLGLLPADQRKQLEETLKQTEAQMKSPEMQKLIRDGIVADRNAEQQSYQASLAAWQARYPDNPSPLVAKRLRAFLDTSADVDFAASLVSKGGKLQFVNPKYEAKPAEWKLCYRAGREAVSAARTVAAAWLKEIGG